MSAGEKLTDFVDEIELKVNKHFFTFFCSISWIHLRRWLGDRWVIRVRYHYIFATTHALFLCAQFSDPDYENKITEEEQRWGVGQANHRSEAIDMRKLIEETGKNDAVKKQQLIDESGITGSKGYGGKFGVEKDRMDKSAMGHNFIGKAEKHASQITSTGFGGKFGVEKDRMDKSAVGFSESVGKIGTNYCPIKKPDILGAKPASYRSKFENLQVHTDADSKERAAEQKKLREEKDNLDREQALKEQVSAFYIWWVISNLLILFNFLIELGHKWAIKTSVQTSESRCGDWKVAEN